jgi:hypothetical protein
MSWFERKLKKYLTGGILIGDNGNTASFDSSGHLIFAGTAKPWEDLRIEPIARTTGANAPTFEQWFTNGAGSRGVYLYSFDDVAAVSEKEIFFTMQMPHAWKEGSTIYPHVHWHQSAATTPVFQMDYRWANIGAAAGSFTTAYTMATKAMPYVNGTIHQISTAAAGIDGTGKTMSSILQIKLYRNDSAYQGDCLVTSFDIHYEIDSMGSNEEYVK